VRMTDEVMDFIHRNKPALVATASRDGLPNVAPKGTLTAYDEEHLVYADLVPGRTTRNIQENGKVSVVVLDPQTMRGYQIKGTGKIEKDIRVRELSCQLFRSLPMKIPEPKEVVLISVEDVIDLAPSPARKRT